MMVDAYAMREAIITTPLNKEDHIRRLNTMIVFVHEFSRIPGLEVINTKILSNS